jgi:hypothetical protein
MTSLFSEQRLKVHSALAEYVNYYCGMIAAGEFRNEGRGPPFLYQSFIEACACLLYLGDVFGYLVADEGGVVESTRSYGPFLEGFVKCLELCHTWCMRFPPEGKTPKDRRWLAQGATDKVLHSVGPLLRLKMVSACYAQAEDKAVLPDGFLTMKDHRLRSMFVQQARILLLIAERGSDGQCEPLRIPSAIHQIECLLLTTDGQKGARREKPRVCLRLSPTFDVMELCDERQSPEPIPGFKDWELYWALEAYAPHQSLVDDVKRYLTENGVEVGSPDCVVETTD